MRLLEPTGLDVGESDLPEFKSEQIYWHLVDEIGAEQARFDDAFDLPLQIVSTDDGLREELGFSGRAES